MQKSKKYAKKYARKILITFLVAVILCSICISPISAAVVSVPDYYVNINETVIINDGLHFPGVSLIIDPFNSTRENYTTSYTYDNYSKYSDIDIVTTFSLTSKDGSYLLEKGGTATLGFSGVWLGGRFDYGDTQFWTGKSYLITVNIFYSDGSVYTIRYSGSQEDITTDYNSTSRLHSFRFSFLPDKNVSKIDYICEATYGLSWDGSLTYNYRLGEFDDPATTFSLSIGQESLPTNSDDGSIVGGITSYLQNAFGGFWDYFDSFSDYFNSLKSLLTNSIPYEIRTGITRVTDYLKDTYEKLNSVASLLTNHLTDSFVTGLKNVRDYIVDTYNKVFDLYNVINKGIQNKLFEIGNGLLNLPNFVITGVKEVFLPDIDVLEKDLKAAVENIGGQFGVHFDTYDRLFDAEMAPEDVVKDYTIHGLGTLKLKFFDTSYLIKGVNFFRPFIRGFLVLLLVFYNWKQALTLFDQNPSIAGAAVKGLSAKGGEPGE